MTLDLFGVGAPARSYATAGIALRILWPRKHRHCVKNDDNECYCVRFQILTEASMNKTALSSISQCSLEEPERRPRSAYCLHSSIMRARPSETSVSLYGITQRNNPGDCHTQTEHCWHELSLVDWL
jgi:hypothetical protein